MFIPFDLDAATDIMRSVCDSYKFRVKFYVTFNLTYMSKTIHFWYREFSGWLWNFADLKMGISRLQ